MLIVILLQRFAGFILNHRPAEIKELLVSSARVTALLTHDGGHQLDAEHPVQQREVRLPVVHPQLPPHGFHHRLGISLL